MTTSKTAEELAKQLLFQIQEVDSGTHPMGRTLKWRDGAIHDIEQALISDYQRGYADGLRRAIEICKQQKYTLNAERKWNCGILAGFNASLNIVIEAIEAKIKEIGK